MATTASASPGGDDGKRPSGSLPVPRSRRGLKGFYNEVVREMKKVSWPTKHETNRLTGVVLVMCLAMVVLLTTMGYIFETLINLITKGKV